MPDVISVDISGLETGERLTVADLMVSGDLKILTEPDKMVVMVMAPRVAEDPEEDAAREVKDQEDTAGEAAGEAMETAGAENEEADVS